MLTGELRSQVDRLWDTFWSGGISNPLEVIEQITYLLFIRRLDDLETLEENKASRLKRPMERRIFPTVQRGFAHRAAIVAGLKVTHRASLAQMDALFALAPAPRVSGGAVR